MGGLSIWHILILAVIALVLFGGKGKISDLMGDFGKGVNSFKKGLGEGAKEDPRIINGETRTDTTTNTNKDHTTT
jgi:sec-independent protein translocase protein TatA